jgi:hypothetical protein
MRRSERRHALGAAPVSAPAVGLLTSRYVPTPTIEIRKKARERG